MSGQVSQGLTSRMCQVSRRLIGEVRSTQGQSSAGSDLMGARGQSGTDLTHVSGQSQAYG